MTASNDQGECFAQCTQSPSLRIDHFDIAIQHSKYLLEFPTHNVATISSQLMFFVRQDQGECFVQCTQSPSLQFKKGALLQFHQPSSVALMSIALFLSCKRERVTASVGADCAGVAMKDGEEGGSEDVWTEEVIVVAEEELVS
ncbi:hypothetical protein C3L33_10558, partial [Rhododendron williamsianum]